MLRKVLLLKRQFAQPLRATCFWLAAVLLVASLVTFLKTARRAHAAAPISYTVYRTEQVFDQSGVLRFAHSYAEAVRSDGSRMWRGTTGEQQARRIYFANGDYVRTSELTGRKSTFPGLYAGSPAVRDPTASCITSEETRSGWSVAGEDSIGGYHAVRVVKSTPGQVYTMWYAPNSGCAMLQFWFQHETGITKQNFTALVPGEPDPALFQISTALKEGPPSSLPCPQGQDACGLLPPAAAEHWDNMYSSSNIKTR